jgi:serine/threonine protein phosphatase PrpC
MSFSSTSSTKTASSTRTPGSKAREVVSQERRRLTLSSVDKPASDSPIKIPEDDAGLMAFLKDNNVVDMMASLKPKKSAEADAKLMSFLDMGSAAVNPATSADSKTSAPSESVEKKESAESGASSGSGTVMKKMRGGVRRMSIGSMTNAVGQESFGEKPTEVVTEKGAKVDGSLDHLNQIGVGVVCRKGLKPESPNQDSFSFLYSENEFYLAGVYDGHGAAGHHVSHFVKDALPKLFLTDPNRDTDTQKAFESAFMKTQKLILASESEGSLSSSMSGTTCTLMYFPLNPGKDGKRRMWMAHVGDSKSVMISYDADEGKFVGRDLTKDHKPCVPAEKKRIEANGGRVIFDGYYNYRVFARGQMYPGLNMSRAFGDTTAHREAGLCAIPEVNEIVLNPEDRAVLLCTDGVWEFIDAPEAAQYAMQEYNRDGGNVQVAAERLAKRSWDYWMEDSENEISDDITSMVCMIPK